MLCTSNTLPDDDALDRAYRLALAIHELTIERVELDDEATAIDVGVWVLAAELLHVIDEARVSGVKRATVLSPHKIA